MHFLSYVVSNTYETTNYARFSNWNIVLRLVQQTFSELKVLSLDRKYRIFLGV